MAEKGENIKIMVNIHKGTCNWLGYLKLNTLANSFRIS